LLIAFPLLFILHQPNRHSLHTKVSEYLCVCILITRFYRSGSATMHSHCQLTSTNQHQHMCIPTACATRTDTSTHKSHRHSGCSGCRCVWWMHCPQPSLTIDCRCVTHKPQWWEVMSVCGHDGHHSKWAWQWVLAGMMGQVE
jgi:hypothetical protein